MNAWQTKDARYCWHPFTRHSTAPTPLPIVSASGAWLHLADGRQLLDAIASWWCCIHGHSHPRLVKAIHHQASTLDHVLFAGCSHEPASQLSEKLVSLVPNGLQKVFYSDDGSTAVEVALKMVIQAWYRRGEPRTHFIALKNGYHGDTFGAMSAGEPGQFFAPFTPLLFDVTRVPPNIEALREVLERRSDIAGIILEPGIQAAGGMVPVSPDLTRGIRQLCDEHNIYMVADEVFTGFGRTGHWFACQGADITPDIICLAKALTNGMYPLSATIATEELFQAFQGTDAAAMLLHGHTLTANPMGCAIALESLALAEEANAPTRYATNAALIADAISTHLVDPKGIELRVMGGVVALEISDKGGYLSSVGPRILEACKHEPVLLRPLGNVLYAVPPLCVTADECQLIGKTMAKVAQTARLQH
ncbi:MAG: adenosylmethionine--8-amino-7-oxononanoate transaminase [Myxococcales bacterium]|nr:adenosylmethionine--8-amino-7-oxononanoate transaminase [Myxococcales bacterium]